MNINQPNTDTAQTEKQRDKLLSLFCCFIDDRYVCLHTVAHYNLQNVTAVILMPARMWANAQRDGRPAKYRWCPLFNAAKFG